MKSIIIIIIIILAYTIRFKFSVIILPIAGCLVVPIQRALLYWNNIIIDVVVRWEKALLKG